MLRLSWLLLAFSGCFLTPDHEQIPLANLDQTTIEIEPPVETNPGEITIYFDTQSVDHPGDNPAECPTAPSSLHATVDGLPLSLLETGGWDAPVDGTSECHQIRFGGFFTPDPRSSQVVITDDTTTWTIATHSFALFDHLLVRHAPNGELVVASGRGQAITYLQLGVSQGTSETFGTTDLIDSEGEVSIAVAGSTATMPLPTTLSGAVTIDVEGRTTPTIECDGPIACKLDDALSGTLDAVLPM
jgi:hypothetical protein